MFDEGKDYVINKRVDVHHFESASSWQRRWDINFVITFAFQGKTVCGKFYEQKEGMGDGTEKQKMSVFKVFFYYLTIELWNKKKDPSLETSVDSLKCSWNLFFQKCTDCLGQSLFHLFLE